MNVQQVNELISGKMKLIRIEKGYTQDKMAEVLGISKKTLVQIEKGRTLAGWTTAVALCALFRDSEVLHSILGDDPLEVLETIAHDVVKRPKTKTLGGKVWWKEIQQAGKFRLQQHLITGHYRILDADDYLWYSSFDKEEALVELEFLAKKDGVVGLE